MLKRIKDLIIKKYHFQVIILLFALALLLIWGAVVIALSGNNLFSVKAIEWAILSFLSVLISIFTWKPLTKWIRHNRHRIYGRLFEYLFFIFIFLSSYTLCFIDRFDLIYVTAGFSFTAVSAAYCGWLHYVEGYFEKDFNREPKETLYWYSTEIFKIPSKYYLIGGISSGFIFNICISIGAVNLSAFILIFIFMAEIFFTVYIHRTDKERISNFINGFFGFIIGIGVNIILTVLILLIIA